MALNLKPGNQKYECYGVKAAGIDKPMSNVHVNCPCLCRDYDICFAYANNVYKQLSMSTYWKRYEGIVYNKNTSHSPCKYKSQPLEDAAMATGRGYEKGDGKTKKGSVQQQLPLPSTQSTASSSSSEPMQTQQQQVASTPPNSITTGSQNVSLNSTFISRHQS